MPQNKCSLSLYTKVKDKRDLICNLSCEFDKKYNVLFTKEDGQNKCMIFDIPNLKTDFITKKKIGTGDHYYELGKNCMKKKIIGSDSEWNIIPTSGSRSKDLKYNYLKPISFNDNYDISKLEEGDKVIINKLRKWKEYVTSRGAKLFYKVPEEFIEELNKRDEEMVNIQNIYFNKLRLMLPED